jgi:hypothetical protein
MFYLGVILCRSTSAVDSDDKAKDPSAWNILGWLAAMSTQRTSLFKMSELLAITYSLSGADTFRKPLRLHPS